MKKNVFHLWKDVFWHTKKHIWEMLTQKMRAVWFEPTVAVGTIIPVLKAPRETAMSNAWNDKLMEWLGLTELYPLHQAHETKQCVYVSAWSRTTWQYVASQVQCSDPELPWLSPSLSPKPASQFANLNLPHCCRWLSLHVLNSWMSPPFLEPQRNLLGRWFTNFYL